MAFFSGADRITIDFLHYYNDKIGIGGYFLLYIYVMNHVRGLLRQEGIRLKAKALSSGEIFVRLRESGGIPVHFVPILACYESTIAEI